MAAYRVVVTRAARKDLDGLQPEMGRRILARLLDLADHPRPRQSHKLWGSEGSYRLRVGDYRVLYAIDEDTNSITIYAIGHRREVYRRR